MARRLNHRTKSNITFSICILAFIILQILIVISDNIRGLATPFNGVIMAFQFAICLIMIQIDNKKGYIISIILMTVSVINMLSAMLFRNIYTPIPGICNSIIYIGALFVLTKQFEHREKDAITDMLTGLRNRRGLFSYLDTKIIAGDPFHVIYIDLGNFKFINDNYGHICGDYVMQTLASRMRTQIGDKGICARIGGDEFVIVLDGENDPGPIAKELIAKIGEKIKVPLDDYVDCYLTSFAGIASFPKDAANYEDLIKYADIAMYKASQDKSNKVCYFDQEMHSKLNRRVELEKLIKEGFEKDFFYLVYQPQYTINGKQLRGFEALIRMKTDDDVFISPGEFIPVAEKSDLILTIDNYVLKRALMEFRDVVAEKNKDLILSINVSAKNISNNGFVEKIESLLKETNFPAHNLEIEITEYCLVESVDIAISNIRRLRTLGVQVALDDFGTGYTSLSYLAKMPISLLKIDKSLVDDIEVDAKSREFVNTVISLGHQMGCEVISEGVENTSQLDILGNNKCDFVQGFVWSKPLDYTIAIEHALAEIH